MTWFLLMMTITLIVLIPVNIYIGIQVHKLEIIKKIKNKYLRFLASSIFFFITIILMIIDFINTNIIMLHFFFILLIGKILYSVVCMFKRKVKLKYGQEITLLVSLLVTIVYLGYGFYVAHHVIETHYDVVATKDIGVDNFRIVQITDSHIGATMDGEKFYQYMLDINKTNPDIVVITGDFVDDSTSLKDMEKACEGLGILKTKYGVYFVYGNHDKGYYNNRGYGNKELRRELKKNNVKILEDEGLDIVGNIYLYGRKDRFDGNRKTAEQIMENIEDYKYVIVLNHQPTDYDNESNANIDLVISGHTHGGQVFPLQIIDKMIGANNRIYGIEKRNKTTFIVSSGIGDWAVDFKTGTVAEYVVIDIR